MKRRILPVIALIAVAGLSGVVSCSPARVLSDVTPAAPGGEERNLHYEPGARHEMDVYLPRPAAVPAGEAVAKPPIVVFVHGGGWRAGNHAKYGFVGRALARCGAIAVLPEYRIWPQVGFPEFVRDAAHAVKAAREEGVRRGGDPNRLILMGHSAGAHIAAMVTLDPTWLGEVGMDPRKDVAGFVGLAGPYDFDPTLREPHREIFAAAGDKGMPIRFAENARGPMLLLAGDKDTVVEPHQTPRLAAAVRAQGREATDKMYPRVTHEGILRAIAWPLRFTAPVLKDTCRFIRHVPPVASGT